MHYEKIIKFLGTIVVFVLILSAGVRELQENKPQISLPNMSPETIPATTAEPKTARSLYEVLGLPELSDAKTTPPLKQFSNTQFSIGYPEGFTVNKNYKNTLVSFDEQRAGVSFTVPASFTKNTNLGTDSLIAVENYTGTKTCRAQNFFDKNMMIGEEQTITIGTTEVTFAQTADAGAGNRYEEFLVAFPGVQCRGVRLFMHSMALGNFDPNTVTAFDRDQLLAWYVGMVTSYKTK